MDACDLDLTAIMARFSTEETARAFLESVRWPKGPTCPHCGNADASKIYELTENRAKKIRAGLKQCRECGEQFTVTVGTVFERSHVPLNKWLVAWYMLCTSKKGVSAHQIMRMLGIGSYRTAWFMMHRIRYALKDPIFKDQLGADGGTVEADETYIGGRPRAYGPKSKRGRGTKKIPVVSLVERGGNVRSRSVPNVTGKTLKKILAENIHPSANLMTDDYPGYIRAGKGFASHNTVNHRRNEYVRGETHTQTIEGYFSLLKRGIDGTFHHVSRQHLDQYLAEFDFRYNHRIANGVDDVTRATHALKGAKGKRLTYRVTHSNTAGVA